MLTEKAIRYMEAHYAEKFSLKAMSAALFLNGSYLLRAFRRTTGMTLLQYHNGLRCRAACDLLEKDKLKIQQIGFQVGFLTASHFAKVFKSIVGVTPKEYKASHSWALPERTGQQSKPKGQRSAQ